MRDKFTLQEEDSDPLRNSFDSFDLSEGKGANDTGILGGATVTEQILFAKK